MIRIYNMEYGESILLQGDRENLLVDMGSEGNKHNFDKIWNDIEFNSKRKELYIMISHFHDDHINGLYESICKKFGYTLPKVKDIFIPNFLDIKVNEMDYALVETYDYVLKLIIGIKEAKHNLFEVLKYIMIATSKVRFLKRSDLIRVDGKEYRVLWPKPSLNFKLTTGSFRLLEGLCELIDKKVKEVLEQGNQSLYLSKIRDLGFRNIINDIAQKIQIIYLSRYEREGRFNLQETESAINNIQDNLDGIEKTIGILDVADIRKNYQRLRTEIRSLQNDLSIVFHDNIDMPEKNILFTGDIGAKYFEKYIFGDELYKKDGLKLHNKYNVVKAAHHGTKSAYSFYIPDSNKILISNGKTHVENRRGKIFVGYPLYNNDHSGKTSKIICTNQRCEVKDMSFRCVNKHKCGVNFCKIIS